MKMKQSGYGEDMIPSSAECFHPPKQSLGAAITQKLVGSDSAVSSSPPLAIVLHCRPVSRSLSAGKVTTKNCFDLVRRIPLTSAATQPKVSELQRKKIDKPFCKKCIDVFIDLYTVSGATNNHDATEACCHPALDIELIRANIK